MQFHTLKIDKIVVETKDAKTIYFEIPNELKASYQHLAGQYLTIKMEQNGKEVRRAYSICTAPGDSTIGVTVKKVKNGQMSSFLVDQAKAGDMVEVMTPEGHFVVKTDHLQAKDYFFIAAGSGITPVMSMILQLLEHEPKSVCHLLYGSKNEDNIIFKQKLSDLETKYAGQLVVEYVLSQPNVRKEGGFAGLFAKKIIDWKGRTGRINTAICQEFFNNNKGNHQEKLYFVCGPGDLIAQTEKYLLSQNIDKKSIHKEFFASASDHTTSNAGLNHAQVRVTLKGDTFDVEVNKGQTILDALIDLKKDPPYSCTSGACSTCMAKVKSGKVVMDQCFALDDDEIEAGYILTCQAHPDTKEVELTFDM